MKILTLDGLELIVVREIITQAQGNLQQEQEQYIKAIQNAVQNGVARAFGGH